MTLTLPHPRHHATLFKGVTVARAVAWVIDAGVTMLIAAFIVPLTAFAALLVMPFLLVAINLAYRSATLAQFSATPGMWLCGIEFRSTDGRRLDGFLAVAHTLCTLFTWTTVLPQIASCALMLMHPQGRGLTDLLLGTVAIRRPERD